MQNTLESDAEIEREFGANHSHSTIHPDPPNFGHDSATQSMISSADINRSSNGRSTFTPISTSFKGDRSISDLSDDRESSLIRPAMHSPNSKDQQYNRFKYYSALKSGFQHAA
jgi:hypothetical protein